MRLTFYEWHAKALADFEALPDLQGIDIIGKNLECSLGSSVVRKIMDARTESIRSALAMMGRSRAKQSNAQAR